MAPATFSLVLSLMLTALANPAAAQATPPATKGADSLQSYLEGSSNKKLPTLDGVFLDVHYWSPRNANKETPVIVLLHDRGRSQRDWYPTAKMLADEGFAVVSFDFRGHGMSKRVDPEIYRSPAEIASEEKKKRDRLNNINRVKIEKKEEEDDSSRRRNLTKKGSSREQKIDQADLFRSGTETMTFLARDLQAVKKFLVEENNAGRLNLRRLGLAATGVGASVAMTWADQFEFAKKGRAGWTRQAADLGALALISPSWNYLGARLPTSLGDSSVDLPILVISSVDGRDNDSALRLARSYRLADLTPEVKKNRTPRRDGGKEGDPDAKATKPDAKPSKSDATAKASKKGGEPGWIKVPGKLAANDIVRNAEEYKTDRALLRFFDKQLLDLNSNIWEQREVNPEESTFGGGRAN